MGKVKPAPSVLAITKTTNSCGCCRVGIVFTRNAWMRGCKSIGYVPCAKWMCMICICNKRKKNILEKKNKKKRKKQAKAKAKQQKKAQKKAAAAQRKKRKTRGSSGANVMPLSAGDCDMGHIPDASKFGHVRPGAMATTMATMSCENEMYEDVPMLSPIEQFR